MDLRSTGIATPSSTGAGRWRSRSRAGSGRSKLAEFAVISLPRNRRTKMKRDLDARKAQANLTEEAPGFSRRTVAGGFTALVAAIAGSGPALAATSESAPKQYRPVSLGTDYADTDSAYYDPNYPPLHFPHVYMSKGKPIQ